MTKRIGSVNKPENDAPDRGCKIATEHLQRLASVLNIIGFAHIESRCVDCPFLICWDERMETKVYLTKVRNKAIRRLFKEHRTKEELKKMFGMGVKNLNNILKDYGGEQ